MLAPTGVFVRDQQHGHLRFRPTWLHGVMFRSHRVMASLLLAASGVGLLSSCAGLPFGAVGDRPSHVATVAVKGSAQIRELLQEELAAAGVPGGAIAVADRNGLALIECVGEARIDEQPVTPDSVFAYRSITKSFIGVVIAQLIEEGRLRLDDPIAAYVSGVPDGDAITIEQLATMRSGLANYLDLEHVAVEAAESPERAPAVSKLLREAFDASPVFAAGEAYQYSNTNTLLLGEVIRILTGHPWFDEVKERVLQPLGLSSITAGFGGGEVAKGYVASIGGEVFEEPQLNDGWYGAAGALVGTAGDLAKWGVALGGGDMLGAELREKQLRSFGPTDDDPSSPRYDRYGFALGEIGGWIGHTGNGDGFQALVMFDEASGRSVAIVLNATTDDPNLLVTLFDRVRDLL